MLTHTAEKVDICACVVLLITKTKTKTKTKRIAIFPLLTTHCPKLIAQKLAHLEQSDYLYKRKKQQAYNMARVLITGTSGFVGCRVAQALSGQYELLTPSHGECDITSREAVEKYVAQHRPQVILHLGALSNTGYCE